MKNIVRIWLYKVTSEVLKDPDCKPSDTNKLVTKEVRGDFVYYDVAGTAPRETTRREADKWALETGEKVLTWQGYPSWMHDLGFRA